MKAEVKTVMIKSYTLTMSDEEFETIRTALAGLLALMKPLDAARARAQASRVQEILDQFNNAKKLP